MIHVTIATFISDSEQFHPALIETLDFLRRSGIEAEAIVFCDAPLKCGQPRIRQIVDGGKTKYSRILQLFSLASCEKIFCVDNDITIDNVKFKDFVLACASGNFVAAWGKIAALPCAGLVPNLIRIDKIVSHNFLRPLLWKLRLGISLPGQVFMFSRSLLKLPDEDTVFDDLQIGIAIKNSAAPFLYTDAVLGFEQPKLTLPKLVSQRIRWARGYVEVLLLNRKSPALILIHGATWHCWQILFWGIFFACCKFLNVAAALCFAQVVVMIISKNRVADYKFAALYLLMFPFLHVVWKLCVAGNLVKAVFKNFKAS